MFNRSVLTATLLLVACSTQGELAAKPGKPPFKEFYQSFRQQVAAEGLNPALLDEAFDGKVQPYAPAIKSEANQPEIKSTFESYVAKMLAKPRREKGAALLAEHKKELAKASQATGVPPEVIVALWGIESNFGANMGNHPVVPALVTLAWDNDRGEFFGKEAVNALRVARKRGINPAELTGSWAGAMGQCQFMPSNYLKHAADGNGDGKVDIWNTPADVFMSAGTFLKALGWQKDVPWRLPAQVSVKLPESAGFNERGLSEPHPLAQWQRWGVVPKGTSFSKLGGTETALRMYRPLGDKGPTYMLGPNFDVLLRWNYSSYFAASALLLAESIANEGNLPDV
ncbi:MAG: lytic murein transglycosylase [Pseudomonadaceae bacterium]|nr:lytic murein transglycosylase [Pseudomonadaceae bacterium]